MSKQRKTKIKWNKTSQKSTNLPKYKKKQKNTNSCKPTKRSTANTFFAVSIILFSVGLFVIVYVFYLNNGTMHKTQKPYTIKTSSDFDSIKADILKNKQLKSTDVNTLINHAHKTNNIAYLSDKYIAIIKDKKIFLVNAKNDSFITSANISPTPNNDITYYNIFTKDNNILITGYDVANQLLEISQLHLTDKLSIKYDKTYQLSTLPISYDTAFVDNNIVIYTTQNINSNTTPTKLSSIKILDNIQDEFIPQNIPDQSIFYDKLLIPSNPVIHTIAICPFNDTKINFAQCTQKQIIDNNDATFTLGNKNITLTIQNDIATPSLTSIHPYAKKYHIPITNKQVYISANKLQNYDTNSIDVKNLISQKIYNNQKIIVYKQNDNILAKIVPITTLTNSPFSTQIYSAFIQKPTIQEITLSTDKDLQTNNSHINIFNFNGAQFASIALTDSQNITKQIDLLKIADNDLQKVHSLPITTQDVNTPNQFFVNIISNKLYALTGNYLKKFIYNNNNLLLAKTIDYTHKPIYKPRLKSADYPIGAKIENGRYICKKKHHEYIGKSKKNNKGYYHLDRECCLDPDEYPNPWCTYRPGELSVTNLKYKNYTGKKIKIY